MDNVVDNILETIGTFYKQEFPLFQEMMNRCSTRVQFNELSKFMRNQHMKHIAAKGVNLLYDRSKCIVLFGENKTNMRNIECHRFD